MAKQTITITKTTVRTHNGKSKFVGTVGSGASGGKKGNPNRCPTCGRYRVK